MTEERQIVEIAGLSPSGLILPIGITEGGTLIADTELVLAADNVTISNVKTWADTTGTQDFGLIDSSRRPVLSPTSTIELSTTSTVHFDVGSTVQIGTTGTVNFTTGTVGFPVSSTVNIPVSSTINFPVTSTVNIPASSTVQIGVTGTVNFTTGTVGFPVSSTINFPVTSTVQAMTPTNLANTTGTLGMVGLILGSTVNFTTGTVGFPVSSTVNFPITSTVNIGVGSTINFATTSSVNIATIALQSSTAAGLAIVGGTIGVETEFATGSTFSIYPFTSSSFSFINTNSTVNFAVSSTVNFSVGSTVQVMTPPNLNNTTGTIGVVRVALGSTVNFVTGTVGISGGITGFTGVTSTISWNNTSASVNVIPQLTGTFNVKWATTSTLGAAVSWATTSTLGAAISVAANQTGTIPVVMSATSTVTLATTSTVAIGVSGSVSLVGVLTSLNQTTGTIGVVRAGLTTTTATQPISGTVSLSLSNSTQPVSGTVSLGITNATIPVSWATGATVNVSWAQTSTLGAAISGTVTIGTTNATIPVSFSVGSTVNFATTATVNSVLSSRYYTGSQILTGTVVGNSGTVNSGTIDISIYNTKTVSVWVESANNNSTLLIDTAPVASATINNYYLTNISSTSFVTKSFTETFADMRVQVISGTINSTISAWVGRQI